MKLYPILFAAALSLSAPAQVQAASLLHAFEFYTDLSDATGGAATISTSNGVITSGGMAFAANGGPTLDLPARLKTFTLAMKFRIDLTSGMRKLLDFKTLASDGGLYNLNTSLSFFDGLALTATGLVNPNIDHVLVFARDNSNDLVRIFFNDTLVASFVDSTELAVGYNGFIHVLEDDRTTSKTQASSGFLDYLRIYDESLSPAELALIPIPPPLPVASVPLPAPVAMMAAALGGLVLLRRQRC